MFVNICSYGLDINSYPSEVLTDNQIDPSTKVFIIHVTVKF